MNLKVKFLIWCDCADVEMHEAKRNKYEVTFECRQCKRTVVINEFEISF